MRIRRETEPDHAAVADVTAAAFGQQDEARLVEAIRASDEFVPELTLVAEEDGRIVGHVMFSYSALEGSDRRLLQLSPLERRPGPPGHRDRLRAHPRGSEARGRARRAARARARPPDLLPALRLPPRSTLGLLAPNPEWPDDAFMAAPLSAYDPSLRGRVTFAPAFG